MMAGQFEEIKSLMFQEIVSIVVSKIITKVPFLGWPVIGWLFSAFVNYIANKFWDEASTIGMYINVDIREGANLDRYRESLKQLKASIINDNQSEEEKERIRNEYRKSLRDLIYIKPS